MSRPLTIRRSLVLSFAAVIVLILGLLLLIMVIGARTAAEEQSARLLSRALGEAEARMASFFQPVHGLLEVAGQATQEEGRSAEDVIEAIRPVVKRVRQIAAMRTEALGVTWREADFEKELVRWSRPRALPGSGDPGITAYTRARDTVIAADVRLDDISTFTRALDVTPNARVIALVNRRPEGGAQRTMDMAVVGLPRDERYESEASRRDALLKRGRDLGLQVIDDAVVPFLARGPARMAEPLRFESGGDTWWGAISTYPLDPALPLMTAVLIPEDDFLGERATLRLYLLLATALAFGLALAIAAVLSRRAGGQIEALVAQTDRIRQGDFSPGAPIATRLVEVRKLTAAHEDMRKGLASLMRIEHDLQIARRIQQATFPSAMPTLPGYELYGSSVPADDTGGDTYDVIGVYTVRDTGRIEVTEGEGERAVLLLADATGHGIGPAISVAGLIAMLRMAVRLETDMAGIVRHANAQLRADLLGGRFITAWFGELDPATHEMQTFSAGQGPLLIYRSGTDTFEEPKTDSPPLGILAFEVELPPPTTLEPGDIYAVLSDGFHEACNARKEQFGEKGVEAVIRANATKSPEAIVEALHAAVGAFSGNAPADDDRTCVIVKRTAAS